MSFLPGRRGSLGHSQVSEKVLCDMRKTFARFAEDDLHFSWQARHFRHVVLRFFANRIGRAASSGDKV